MFILKDYHDHLSYRSRRLSRYVFNKGRYRDRYYRDIEREKERNRHDREREHRNRERVIRKKDRECDRCRQIEKEEKSSPRRR